MQEKKGEYNPKNIEDKWIKKWEEDNTYKTSELKDLDKTKRKMHVLDSRELKHL
jgi:leucyl-tRNA synthetase